VRWAVITGVSLAVGLCVGGYIAIVSDLPPAESISFFAPPVATKVYDTNGNLLSEFYIEKRELTTIDQVPYFLKAGVICIEDKLFYKHWGVDILALVRSLFTNLIHMSVVQGGSTITMQLARNMFLTLEQTMVRKLKEMALAIRIERAYTKDEILEKYLNQINFGQGHYGVATAARYFFNKNIAELTLSECALLVAIPKSPERFSPYKHPDRAIQRRNFVLKEMYKSKIITREEFESAAQESLTVIEHREEKRTGEYFLEEIRRYLELKYGPEFVYRSGANVYTTLDTRIQRIAERIFEQEISAIEEEYKFQNPKAKFDSLELADTTTFSPYLQGAFVLLDYRTGDVRALIGGRDFSQHQWNHATQAGRQAGSAFKVFVFSAAIDNGFTAADIVLDLPIVLEVPGVDSIYRPSNYDRKFMGPITVRNALKYSRNLAAIRLIRNIGPEQVVQYAHMLGVKSPLLAVVSLALGVCDVSLLEMTSAVGTIANLGTEVEPLYITKITDNDGTIIERNEPLPEQRLSAQTSYIMTSMMESVVNGGTGYAIRQYYKGPAAGKTGTTNNYSDAWFIGFTPKCVAGVWLGFDDNERIFRGATGGRIAAPIWGKIMAAIDTTTQGAFTEPEGIVHVRICQETGLLAREMCPDPIDEVFIRGTEPTEYCEMHRFESGIQYHDDFEEIDPSELEEF
jgi:penicillin-binding protein 1A